MKKPFHCAWCNRLTYREAGHINRACASNLYLYCGRECSGLGRRNGKSAEDKVAEKAAYDAEYRRKNLATIKAKKHAHFKSTYDPAKAAVERKANMARHVEYCRRPEYRVKKSAYDVRRRASDFGEFAEAYMLLSDIQREVGERATRYEIYMANGTINKSLNRRRQYDYFNRS